MTEGLTPQHDQESWIAAHTRAFEPFPLSQAQYGMWFAQQLDPDVPVSIAQYIELRGELDPDLLDYSIDRARCELGSGALRILQQDGEPMQVVALGPEKHIERYDFRDKPDPIAAAFEWMHEEYSTPIDLLRDRIGISALIQVGENHYLWYGRIHHIALDGYAATRWVSRAAEIYRSIKQGREPSPAPFTELYSTYEADVTYRSSARYAADRDFWLERLSGRNVVSSLVEGTAQALPRTKLETAALSPQAAERLENSDQIFGVSAAAVLVGAFAVYLSRMTGEKDVTVSSIMLGRVNKQQRDAGGTFANTFPLRVSVEAGETIEELLQAVHSEQLGTLRHQRFGVEEIRHEIGLGDSPRRLLGPIVNPMLFDQNIDLGDIVGEFTILTSGPVEDLLVNIYPRGNPVRTHVDFRANPNLYTDELLREHHQRYMAFLEEFLSSERTAPLETVHQQTAEIGIQRHRQRIRSEFWRETLSGLPNSLELPGFTTRPNGRRGDTAKVSLPLASDTSDSLRRFARESGNTEFAVLAAIVAAALARITASDDLGLGIPVTAEPDAEATAIVLRTGVDLAQPLTEAALRAQSNLYTVARTALGAVLPEITAALRADGDDERVAPCHAALSVDGAMLAAGSPARGAAFGPEFAVCDIQFAFRLGKGAALTLSFTDDVGTPETATMIGQRVLTLLQEALAKPEVALGDHELLTATEADTLLPVTGPESATRVPLPEVFARSAAANPDGVAIIAGDRRVSYEELDSLSSQLARYLIERAGARPEQLVAMGIARSAESVLATWAIAKTGAGFVPVDPNYPRDRVEHMIEDSGSVVGLTVRDQRHLLPDTIEWIVLDDPATRELIKHFPVSTVTDVDRLAPLRLDNIAYVIYTSGSTGKPKGVSVSHHGLESFAAEQRDAYRVTPQSRVMAFSSPSFDASMLEMLFSLANSATMVIVPPTVFGGEDLHRVLHEHAVTHAFITPMALTSVEPEGLEHVQHIAVGGEALPRELLTKWAPGRTFHNIYGPTETTIVTAISEPLVPGDPISIGGPIRGTRMVILDSRLKPVPMGVAGELYITGLGLARGYHERRELTASRFVADPYAPNGGRMYRTGDLARWAHAPRTGHLTIEYVGRSDFQVKVRGFRIELGEIDTLLEKHPSVSVAATLGRPGPSGDTVLVSYVKFKPGQETEPGELTRHLEEFLPTYMVPSAVVILDEIPLNPVGKLDRNALPEPDFAASTRTRFRAPTNPVEEIIIQVFTDILSVDSIGVDDSFFDTGGNSLIATRAVARINAALQSEITVRDLFEAPTASALAVRVEQHGDSQRVALVPWERPERIPLSLAQQRIWFINQFDTTSPAYNVPMSVRLRGTLDAGALQLALSDVVARHESLRTVFPSSEDGPYQVIRPADESVPDVSPRQVNSDSELAQHIQQFASDGFDVTRELPLRARLFQRTATDHTLVLVVHHICADGFSLQPLARDVVLAYTSRISGGAPEWEPLEVQYADYALWQRALLGAEDDPESIAAQQLRYWEEVLSGVPDVLELPLDHPRPAVQSLRGHEHTFVVPAYLHNQMLELAHTSGSTLFMVVHSALSVLLAKLSGSDDIAIGTPVAGRGEAALDDLIGMFVNTLVLRTDVQPDLDFTGLLAQARAVDIGAFSHSDVPFERLVDVLKPNRSTSHPPLFQVMLEFQNLGEARVELPGLKVETAPLATATAKFDLQVILTEQFDEDGRPRDMLASITYSSDLFERTTIERLSTQFLRVLDQVSADPSLVISEIDLLDEPERGQILNAGTGERADIPEVTLADLFTAQAARTPDAPALEYDGETLSYREFESRASRLARYLIARGVGPDSTVALSMRRSFDLLVGMYAVTLAGGAYVPVDPDHPADRNEYVLETAAPVCVLVSSHDDLGVRTSVPVFVLGAVNLDGYSSAPLRDADRRAPLRADNTAYVIFTSGSTGRPKGVAVTHRAIVNRLIWMQSEYKLQASDVVLQKTPYTFDVSVWEFYWPLQVGAQLVIAKPDGHRDPAYLAELIERTGVSVLHFVPSMLATFAATADSNRATALRSLRAVFCSGEALPPAVVDEFAAHTTAAVHNLYGPTEAAVDVTYHQYTASDTVSVPIGAPVWNTDVLVLDAALRPVPLGVPGELYLAGIQLARGYIKRGDLTADRFVANPHGSAGSRMYRTGDLVRWREGAAGALELDYIGRTDFQVKLRGLRIELPEIEAVLLEQQPVAQSAVLVHQDKHTGDRLIAYVVAAHGHEIDTADLANAVAAALPSYMVPAQFVILDEFPLGATGKLDRKALPVPELLTATADFVTPRTPAEQVIAEMFAALLGIDRVSVNDSFFDLGGNSLVAARLVARINAALGADVGVRDLFDAPTVAALARRSENARGAVRPPLTAGPRPEVVPVSLAQQRMWFINQFDTTSAGYNVPMPIRLTGDIDTAALEQALRDVVERHESLRTVYPATPQGPVQVILPGAEVPIDLSAHAVAGESRLRELIAEFAFAGFDVATAVPLRARLFSLAPDEHVLLVVVHHIASDGFSLAPLARDVVIAYTARANGQEPDWAPLAVQYADYALWQRELLGDENDPDSLAHAQLEYWRTALAGIPEVLELPTDRPRPAVQSLRGAVEEFEISAELHGRMVELARANNTTVFMVVHAAVALLLARLTGSRDIPVGTPIAGRGEVELDELVGMFVNTLVLRTHVDPDASFADLLGHARSLDLAAFAQADLPFERLVEVLNPQRSQAHSPLFQVMLEFQNNEKPRLDLPRLSVELLDIDIDIANFDLQFVFSERRNGISGGFTAAIRYAVDLFDASTVRSFIKRLSLLLEGVTQKPDVPVHRISMMDDTETADVTSVCGGPGNRLEVLPDLLTMGIRDYNAPAVIDGDRQLTYRELEEQSNRIARILIEEGVGPEDFVALGFARSFEWLISLWAVTKAGGAFVPVDPTYPAERIEHMLNDSSAVAGLTSTRHAATLPALVPWWCLDDPEFQARMAAQSPAPVTDAERRAPLRLENSAYLIYTSGSTGKPKGVVVPHTGLDNFTPAMVAHPSVTKDSRVLSFASPSFDASLLEVLMAFGAGASIVLVPPDVYGGEELTAVIRDQRVTHGFITPLGLASLDREQVEHFQFVVVGGEAVPPDVVDHWATGRRLFNGYGPTETTIVATMSDPMKPGEPVRIGKLFNGVTAVVLDQRLQPVPKGIAGELYISGLGVARGYHERFGLTAGRFVANPYGTPGERMYRTGDLVRWSDDYQLEYLGRTDFQVKVRGFRIELGEIDSALASHPSIDFAATLGKTGPSGATVLVAYVHEAPGQTASPKELTDHVAKFLPAYMVPALIMVIDEIPLAVTGKLDRRALPEPDFRFAAVEYRAPSNPIEEILAGVFADVLGVSRISVDENFFDAGGNSLVATRLVARANAAFGSRIGVRDLFEAPTVESLAARIEQFGAYGGDRPELAPRPRPARIPLSPAQQRMWFINQFDPDSPAYNVPMALRLSGRLNKDALERAIGDVLERHESLRTVFPETLDGPVQVIVPATEVGVDLTPIAVSADGVVDHIQRFVAEGFDATEAVPVRAQLLRVSEREHVLVIVVHHIVADGFSMAPLAADVMVAYAARLHGQEPEWTPLAIQYADFALWQRELLGEESDPESVSARQLEYWKSALAGLPDVIDLPADRPRPVTASLQGGLVRFTIDTELHRHLTEVARELNSTMFMLMHAALAVLVSRLSGKNDVAIGTPIAGRGEAVLDPVVGMFVNTLVLRTEIDLNASFSDTLAQIRETDLAAFTHADIAFEQLVEVLRPERSTSHSPLFQVLLEFQNNPEAVLELPELTVSAVEFEDHISKFDLQLSVREERDGSGSPAGIRAGFVYATDLFDEETVQVFADRFVRILRSIAQTATLPVGDIALLSEAEQRAMLTSWNHPGTDIAPRHLANRFAEKAAEFADRTAVTFTTADGVRTLTYAELDARSNRLARRLIEAGAGPDELVAVAVPRDEQLIVALLAVVKSGAGYLPVDLTYPADRIEFMLSDGAPVAVITTAREETLLPAGSAELIHLDTDLSGYSAAEISDADRTAPLSWDHTAYVIYTSGSTGKPKGVAVPHRTVLTLMANTDEKFGFSETDVWTMFHSYAFDFSVWELWGPLLYGGKLVVVDYFTARNPDQFVELVRREGVTVLNQTPSAFYQFAEAERLADTRGGLSLRYIIFGGEALDLAQLGRWYARHADDAPQLVNMYGITETTVHVSYLALDRAFAATAAASVIGQALPGLRVAVLDERLRPVPPGTIGEMYVSGPQLSRGYLRRPDLTASRFVADPYGAPGEVMYRSGDLARWNRAGQLEYLGRSDFQVQLRGFRIELGEIEAALLRYPGVAQSVVLMRADSGPGSERLVGYVVPEAGSHLTPAAILDTLGDTLAAHMVPAAVVVVGEFPLTANGKLDRRALPAPDFGALVQEGRAPATPLEAKLATVFAEVLGLPSVGVDDSFFALGGDSIMSIQLVTRAKAAGIHISPRDVFNLKTVAALTQVARVVGESELSALAELPGGGTGALPLTPVMHWMRERGGHYHRYAQCALLTLPPGIDETGIARTLQAVLDQHDLLRSRMAGAELVVAETGSVRAADLLTHVQVAAAPGAPEFTAAAEQALDEAADRLDPDSGVMLQAVWLDAGADGGRILLVIHHIAIDGVSWRVLVPDLATAWNQITAGEEPQLPPIGTSFRRWSTGLRENAAARETELGMWKSFLTGEDPLLGARDFDPRRDTNNTVERLTVELPVDITEQLLTRVPEAFHGGVNDGLLAGLALALKKWRGAEAPLISLEGHGREEDAVPGADLSRTLGWFTTIFPVRFELAGADVDDAFAAGPAAGVIVKAVKETLRGIPDRGIGYGQLRYLDPVGAEELRRLRRPQVSFNYFGRFTTAELPEELRALGWLPVGDDEDTANLAAAQNGDMAAMATLDINAVTAATADGPVLRATIGYATELVTAADASEFAQTWVDALTAIARHATRPDAGGLTPSDLDLVQTDQTTIDRFEERFRRIEDVWPLSPLQSGLLFHAVLAEESVDAYMVQLVLHATGSVDPERMRRAAQALLDRHANLRVAFTADSAGNPVQVVVDGLTVPLRDIDLSDHDDPQQALVEVLSADKQQQFDMGAAPLIRFAVISLGKGDYRLVITNHHILLDGWSTPLLLRELITLYVLDGDAAQLPAVRSYRDYLAWLRRQDPQQSLRAWTSALAGTEEPTTLVPLDRARQLEVDSTEISAEFTEAETAALTDLSRQLGITLNTVIQTAWGIVLATLTSRDDVVFGTTVSGRPPEISGVEEMVGLFINTLPVRIRLEAGETLSELLVRVQGEQAELLDHHYVQLADIQRAAGAGAGFDTLAVFESYPVDTAGVTAETDLAGMRIAGLDGADAAHYPVTLVAHTSTALHVKLKYFPSLFSTADMHSVLQRYVRMMRHFAHAPEQRYASLCVLDPDEYADLVPVSGVRGRTVRSLPELLADAVAENPDGLAVIDGEREITYRELDRVSSQLARVLLERGVKPETFVALGIARSLESILGIWAVTKAGGAYVPVDPTYPVDRIEHMLTDSGAALGLTTRAHADALPGDTEWLVIDTPEFAELLGRYSSEPIRSEERHGPVLLGTAAYIIYTSGSTGKPKGVLATHRGLENFALEAKEHFQVSRDARVMHFSSPSFDASVLELLQAFGSAATMVIIPPTVYGGAELAEIIRTKKVTHAFITPLALGSMDPQGLEHFSNVSVGGEAVPPDLVDAWAPGRNLYNGYGPTETTIMVAISPPMAAGEQVLIGGPIRGTRALVLDARLQPVPVGVSGELYVTGEGLTRGYHERRGLTAERFIANPYGEPGERMYRTGDVVRWLRDKQGDLQIDYVGRSDFQVKVRGFRIELGEIDAALRAHPAVGFAATIGHTSPNGQTTLVAYVQPHDDGRVNTEELAEFVGRSLPSHMVPSVIIPIDEVPRTPVGKLDRRALPSPDSVMTEPEYVAPRNVVEEIIAGVFAEVLSTERVSVSASFFDLGGNSLVATRVIARVNEALGVALGVRELFDAPTVAELANRAEAAGSHGPARPALEPRPRPDYVPVSLAQQRMWFINQFDTSSPAYNVPLAVRLTGPLNVDALAAALRDVVERHEALRTVFPDSVQGPSQVIVPASEVVAQLSPQQVASEAELRARIIRLAGTGFDVAAEVPLRARLFQLSATQHVLLVVVHHISADGFSMGPLARDVVTAYHARKAGNAPAWAPLQVQYADYSLWQRETLGDENEPASLAARQIDYWKRALTGLPDVLELPTDRPRPAQQTLRGADYRFTIPADLHAQLEQLARRQGATVFMVLHSALAVLLSRLSGTTDIAIGTPVAGRGEAALDDLIGMFVNTLVLRTEVEGAETFEELLAHARETDLSAFAHSDVPFERLVEVLNPDRSTAHSPLFQATIEFQNITRPEVELDGLHVEPLDFETSIAKYDLELILGGDGATAGQPDIEAAFTYATDLFDADTIAAFADRYVRILRAVVDDPQIKVGDIPLLSGTEVARYAPVHGPEGLEPRLLPDILADAARRDPDAHAVVMSDAVLTYRQLDERSNQLARVLAKYGAGPEKVVALGLPRSIESVLAVWAVAKTGAAFVPVDPRYPADRIEHMLTDSAAVAGLTVVTHREALPGTLPWLELDGPALSSLADAQSTAAITDADRIWPLRLAHPAYLIYTSGSTGKPKGVAVTHYGLASLAAEERDHLRVTSSARVLHSASPSFDASVFEMLMAYSAAATLVVAPPDVYGGAPMAELLRKQKISHAFFTPAVLASVEEDEVDTLRSILVAGDVCPPELVSRWAPGRAMVNAYGPTETTIMSSITAPMAAGGPVTIGATTRGFMAMVLDGRLQPQPPGVAGELYLAGPALARGYQGRLGLTSERFVANPFGAPGERMYRTGDVVRWVERGGEPELEFMGRSDFQVKIRGLRIELGEIDTALASHPRVSFATTAGVDGPAGETILVSYVVPHAGGSDDDAVHVTASELTAYLAEFLPSYMVPSVIMPIDEVPLTPVGKLDRKALPAPDLQSLRREYVAPRDAAEEAVAGAFAQVLGIEQVSVYDSFFDLGGNSLSVTRVVAELEKTTGRALRLQSVFLNPTPAALAERLSRPDDAPSELAAQLLAPVIRLRQQGRSAPVFLVHPGVGLSWAYTGLTQYIPDDHPVYGLQLPSLTGAEPSDSIEHLAATYVEHIRKIAPNGPYHLAGWSLGGVIAQEMAAQLSAAGEDVGLLAMLDSYVAADTDVPDMAELIRSFGVDVPEGAALSYEAAAAELDSAFGQPTGLTAAHIERIHRGFADAARIMRSFEPNVYSGRALFFAADNTVDPAGVLRTPREWAQQLPKMRVVDVPVRHQQMIEPDALAVIGPVLAQFLKDETRGRRAQ
ncbi:non-ribosomal peptide synthase/polyketide synthase [Hoyosella sp. YIM 151337]|uniref:non-ribosomal peptide synthetase n=1 Tax=Hoyosella sp. YIM 151337 TaxID=2992742 RepID=UPI0022364A89|nr:non-ribosomal peptide synthetase [Hoyosella sp. YIM 151337]MCW4352546.1 non-ribosomal peptide synthase/polyketide synthase [Hoyosella sp. YIM 151337]